MLSRYDPKSLSKWIELDFFRRPGRLRRARRIATIVCMLAALGVVAIGLLPANHAMYQAGPLSPAHAQITDCAVCHTQSFSPVQRLWPSNAGVGTVPDSACVRCHDPGPHHPEAMVGSRSCSSCHHEHHGKMRLADQVGDSHCTSCHADLNRAAGVSEFARVSGFPAGHPEFKLFRDNPPPRDPVAMNFSHEVHLRKEGVPVLATHGDDDKNSRTWKRLECISCHQADDSGRYFKPINYMTHCASCHPLSVRVENVGEKQAERFARTPAPHLAPALVRAELRSRLLDLAALAQPTRAEVPDHPLPGRRRVTPLTDAERQWANRQLERNERLLFDLAGGCRYCHHETSDPARRPDGLPTYAKSAIEERWFTHARFRHQSHRTMDCLSCHPGAATSAKASDVLIPSMDNCKECHNPKSGVRNDCMNCHDYHHSPQRLGPSGLEGAPRERAGEK